MGDGIFSEPTIDLTNEDVIMQSTGTEIVTEDHVTKLERAAFMKLVKTEGTLARMEHMLTTGKPLRN
ncbi:MAG: hypothetical protein HC869_18765 [Rhodospirillales bacterium]|nr:hypothetical protein [Rhodospirillales bacterium]